LHFVGNQAIAQPGPPTMSVNVANTPLPVTVTNPTAPPSSVNVGNPQALAAAIAQALRGTPVTFSLSNHAGPPQSYPVPVGQRLIIEYVSGSCGASMSSGGQAFYVLPEIAVTTNGNQYSHFSLSNFSQMLPQILFLHLFNSVIRQKFMPAGSLLHAVGCGTDN
jgi:hypothetical protein